MVIQRMYHVRKLLRLDGYDYSQPGGYFITKKIDNPQVVINRIVARVGSLTRFSQIVNQFWLDLQNHFPNIILDAYCVLSNHFHGFLIKNNHGCVGSPTPARLDRSRVFPPEMVNYKLGQTRHYTKHTISEIFRTFKSY